MVFTIGHTTTYEEGIETYGKNFLKLGRTPNYKYPNGTIGYYDGGIIFRTEENAKQFLIEQELDDYSVYGVIADWEEDTAPSRDGSYRSLLVSKPILKLW